MLLAAAVLWLVQSAPARGDGCAGDCNADDRVLINELITCVNMGLDLLPMDACPGADGNADEQVAINELITAVNSGLFGCGGREASLVSAHAPSNHYVEVRFSAWPGSGAGRAESYSIRAPGGATLAVHEVWMAGDGRGAVLVTDAQQEVRYSVSVAGLVGEQFFDGSGIGEGRLEAAIPLDNSHVLLRFSSDLYKKEQDKAAASAIQAENYAIGSPKLDVLAAEFLDGFQLDGVGEKRWVLLTTSAQARVEYTVRAAGVKDQDGRYLDPRYLSATFTGIPPSGAPGPDDTKPRVVGAASTGNTTVVVQFSQPMGDSVLDPASYDIVQVNVNPEVGGLEVLGAEFLDDARLAVRLTTRSQNEVNYRVTVVNVLDLAGNPLAGPIVSQGVLVDPTSKVFSGTPPSGGEIVDSDGDGIPDHQEQRGWTCVLQLADNQTYTLQLTSDPDVADTDGDGLSDLHERSLCTDPRSADTDGDRLSDYEEYNVVYSSPTRQDSDGDGLSDGDEVEVFRTNANVADSDGDGFTDPAELFELNRDPRIADLPEFRIRIGEMHLQLDERFTYVDEDGETRTEQSTTDTTLTRTSGSSYGGTGGTIATGGNITKETFQGGLGTTECHSYQTFEWYDIFTCLEEKLHAVGGWEDDDYTLTDTYDLTTWSNTRAAEEAFQQSQEKGQQYSTVSAVTRQVEAGRVDVAVTLENASDVALALSNVEITALATDPEDRSLLVPVATLLPSSTLLTGAPAVFHLGPLAPSRGPVVFSNSGVYPLMVEDLMRDPRAVAFEVANYDVTDEYGRNFAFLSQAMQDRTAGISFDFGDGTVRRYRVVTNAAFRRDDGVIEGGFDEHGEPRGVSMDYLLQDLLGLQEKSLAHDPPDGILAGENGFVDSIAQGDDVQLVPAGTFGVPPDTLVVAAGENGVLDTMAGGDDVEDIVTGYETSTTCNADTPDRILPGDDGELDSVVPETRCVSTAGGDHYYGEPCARHEDCGSEGAGEDQKTGFCRGDVLGSCGEEDCIEPGPDGFIDAIRRGDDVLVAPGIPCDEDIECQVAGDTDGACGGPTAIVRVEHRRSGDFRRFWIPLLPDDTQYQTDFGQIRVRPGDTIALAFVEDRDRDGLIAPVEAVYGSSDTRDDTDDDGLDDFAEIHVGWTVAVAGEPLRRVYPDPAQPDSDRDGLLDREEMDVSGLFAAASDVDSISFQPDHRLATDPRRRDTDGDRLTDTEEVLGFLTGAGIVDIPDESSGQIVITGDIRRADTQACPDRQCICQADDEDVCGVGVGPGDPAEPEMHCRLDHDCPDGFKCRDKNTNQTSSCDDIQVVPVGTAGLHARTVVVLPGPNGVLDTTETAGDVVITAGDGYGNSLAVADDVPVVGPGDPVSDSGGCFDRSSFPLCSVVKPGPNGIVQSTPGGDDVLALGQRLEATDPTDPDTDVDQVDDGIEQRLGSSPNDPQDTGVWLDSDRDGLTDLQEAELGWFVELRDCDCPGSGCPLKHVFPNRYAADTDLDGLPDYLEYVIGTDPTSEDTDGDGLTDYNELSADDLEDYARFGDLFAGFRLDPTGSAAYGTDPLAPDTDCDQRTDDAELFESWMLRLPATGETRQVFSDPRRLDTDGDGLNDFWEHENRTDPEAPDTDGDGLLDSVECEEATCVSDPSMPDRVVTVRYHALELVQGLTSSAGLGWDFRLLEPYGSFPGSSVIATGKNFPGYLCEAQGGTTCGERCSVPSGATVRMPLAQKSFAIRAGESFVLSGEVNDYDSCAPADPARCHFTFFQTYDYGSLRDGVQVVTFEGQATGGLGEGDQAGTFEFCQFRVVAAITVGAKPPADSDSDGLTDAEEQNGWSSFISFAGDECGVCARGTRVGEPCVADEACQAGEEFADGACARAGVAHYTSEPGEADTDGDLLPDFVERRLGTNPRSADTDCDGLEDVDEAGVGAWIAENAGACPAYRQLEREEIDAIRADCAEHFNCWVVGGGSDTSPTVGDTDCDGLEDARDTRQEQLVIVYPEWFFTGGDPCPWVWKQNPVNGHWYTLSSPGTWTHAKEEAASLGGYLVAITSADEEIWIEQNFLGRRFTTPVVWRWADVGPWIGLTDESVEGTFEWDSGEECAPARLECTSQEMTDEGYANFAAGQPDNESEEDQVLFVKSSGSWFWNDADEAESYAHVPGIIELERIPPSWAPDAFKFSARAGVNAQWPERAISEVAVVVGEFAPCPDGFEKINVDLNRDAGGNFIWLCYKKGLGPPITGIDVKIGQYTPCDEGFTKIDVDLNRGAGGNFLWLCYSTVPSCSVVSDIDVKVGQYAQCDDGFTKIDVDLNRGVGGWSEYIWLCYKKSAHEAEGCPTAGFPKRLLESAQSCPEVCGGPDSACEEACTDTEAPCEGDLDPLCHHCVVRQGGNLQFPNMPQVFQKQLRDDLAVEVELWGAGEQEVNQEPVRQSCDDAVTAHSRAALGGKLARYTPLAVPLDGSSSVWTLGTPDDVGPVCEDCCLADDAFVFGVEAFPLPPATEKCVKVGFDSYQLGSDACDGKNFGLRIDVVEARLDGTEQSELLVQAPIPPPSCGEACETEFAADGAPAFTVEGQIAAENPSGDVARFSKTVLTHELLAGGWDEIEIRLRHCSGREWCDTRDPCLEDDTIKLSVEVGTCPP